MDEHNRDRSLPQSMTELNESGRELRADIEQQILADLRKMQEHRRELERHMAKIQRVKLRIRILGILGIINLGIGFAFTPKTPDDIARFVCIVLIGTAAGFLFGRYIYKKFF